jgi:hypothetical protein
MPKRESNEDVETNLINGNEKDSGAKEKATPAWRGIISLG